MEPQDKKSGNRVSSIDVARRAGVSQATVSRVFSPNGSIVSAESTMKVLKAAEELKYVPNILARGLTQSSTKIVGIVNPRFEGQFYVESLQYLTLDLQKKNYTTMLLNIPQGAELADIIPIAFQYQVDGIIITSVNLSSGLLKQCMAFGVPVVQYNRYSQGMYISSVCLDNARAGREVAEYLIGKGHKQVVYVSGDVNSSTNKDRENGFVTTLNQHGMDVLGRYEGDYSYGSGFNAGRSILSKKIRPDAVFCASDEMAMGVMDCASLEFGLRIPEDLSVMGFNDISMASTPRYNLTTVNQPVKRMAEVTVSVLRDLMENQTKEVMIRMLPGEIVERNSVADRTA